MTWLLRLAILLAAFFLLRWLWRWFWRTGWGRVVDYAAASARPRAAPTLRSGKVKRDPVCGTFVDVDLSVRDTAGGATLYFCSDRCRRAYFRRESSKSCSAG